MHHASTALTVLACGLALVGCASEETVGHYWSITARAVEDRCTGAAVDKVEQFEYRVKYEGTDVEIAVGEDVFATGIANGCQLSYESIVWTDERDGYDVSWKIMGQALAQHGGNACDPNTDWIGTEIFEIVKSEDPSLSPGCEYEMELEGKYLEEVK